MKITRFDVRRYSKPFEKPISNGKYTYYATNTVICQVHTDEGLTGVGWVDGTDIVFDALKQLEAFVVGEDPFNVERIWSKMYLPKIFGRKGLTTRAMSAVDIALWDIIGKASGRPLYQLLGGFRDEVPVYIAGGYYETDKSHSELREEMEQNIAKGIKAIKMKIGKLSLKEDLKRIEVIREQVGDAVEILVDANNAYNRLDALRMGRMMEDLNVYWFEEPLAPDDLEGAAELAKALDTPIASGENEYTLWGFRDIITSGSVDIINADAQVLGGITEWRKVASFAMAHHIPIAPHGSQEIHVHLVSAVPNGLIVEYYDSNLASLSDLMFEQKLSLNPNGTVSPFKGPGLGVTINFEAIEPYRIG